MSEKTIQCSKCQMGVPGSAEKCPECGYSAKWEQQKVGYFLIGAGAFITLTFIGAVIGVPMIVLGLKKFYDAQDLTVDDEAVFLEMNR